MNACDLQQALFRTLRERASRPRQLASELSGIIYKSKPTIYKKMQGNIALTMDELIAICSHYHLDLDPLLQKAPTFNSVLLEPCDSDSGAGEALYTQIHHWSLQADTQVIVDVSGLFAYAFLNPEIAAFILYWERSCNDSGIKFNMFDARYDAGATSLASRISNTYRSVRRVEVWRQTMFDHILSLIAMALESDRFLRPTDALRLCDALHRNLIQLHERYLSRLDRKSGQVTIYLTSDILTSNQVCINSGKRYALYRGHWYRNWTLTHSPLIAKPAFENAVKLKQPDSFGSRAALEDDFFAALANKIKQTRRNIEQQLYSVAR